jgi:hypothetical protein
LPATEEQKKRGQRVEAGHVLMAGAELSDELDTEQLNNEATKDPRAESRGVVAKSLKR